MNDVELQDVRLETTKTLLAACAALRQRCVQLELLIASPAISIGAKIALQGDLDTLRQLRDMANQQMGELAAELGGKTTSLN